jgi:tRNA-modifying protein YgfZ
MADLNHTSLDDLAVLDARGPGVLAFLQGQLSHDVTQLAQRGSLLAALNNAQGRVLTVLRLVQVAPDHVLIVLPAEVAEPVRQLLLKYVLRAKVTITPGTAWRVYGIAGPDAAAAARTRLHMPMDAHGWRQLIVAPRSEPAPESDEESRDFWRLADIEAGIPEILAATSGNFVAQMLNLDLLDAISFSKGCYTGQEVIARAHYRGQVKRRMQRFFTESVAELLPGARVQLVDGRSAHIVAAAPAEGGGQQFLAVTETTSPASATGQPEPSLITTQLPLPYTLPTN